MTRITIAIIAALTITTPAHATSSCHTVAKCRAEIAHKARMLGASGLVEFVPDPLHSPP
jgi:hypothetical protein